MTHEWIYEPCENVSGRDDKGRLYPHAVKGLKPAGRRVMGYGMEEEDAYADAREKARQHDEGEVLGERGEARAVMTEGHIAIDVPAVFAAYANRIGKNVTDLTRQDQQQATIAAVLDAAHA